MAIVELVRPRGSAVTGQRARDSGPPPRPDRPPAVSRSRISASRALLAALLAVLLYGAFAGGASTDPTEARIQVALGALTALVGAGWVWSGAVARKGIRIAAPRATWAGVALLAAFAAWSGITVLWSVAPNGTWLELNRAIAYVLVIVSAIALGASHPRAARALATGFRLVVLAVTVYALGQKIAPGVHVPGLFDLNQTTISPRLRAPLDYWNALALFITFGVPLVLAAGLDRDRSDRSRLAWLLVLPAMLLAIGLTYSRGGLIALVLAIVASAWLGCVRLRLLVALAVAIVAAAPSLAVALSDSRLTSAGVSLSARETAGVELGVVLVVSLALLWWVGRMLLAREHRAVVDPERVHRLARGLVSLAVSVAVCGVIAVAVSPRGLPGTVSHLWHRFTSVKSASLYEPNRLLSTDSGNRWVWWKEAAGAFSDRPLQGWGAGSFPVIDLLYRRDGNLSVRQPHDVPLQFLAETGAVGAMLAVGGFALLMAAGVGSVRRLPGGQERVVAAALLAGAVAYAVHALYDWDWDIPGVTLPALAFLGVLAGARAVRTGSAADAISAAAVPLPENRLVTISLAGPGPGARVIAVAAISLLMCLYGGSAALPSFASSGAASALVGAGSSSPARLRHALATAEFASSLDPLSDDGLKAAATIALHTGDLRAARRYLLEAVHRDPSDVSAWQQLANLEELAGDHRGLQVAARRVLALDPRGGASRTIAQTAVAALTPPGESGTATGTPLPAGA
jgi:hypothetical protein